MNKEQHEQKKATITDQKRIILVICIVFIIINIKNLFKNNIFAHNKSLFNI
jgi:hypothetical protein